MKIALLVSDDPHHEYLVNLLAEHFTIRGVIVEPGRAQRHRLWQRKKYVDWCYRRYHGLRRRLQGHARYRDRFFTQPPVAVRDFERLDVDWINSQSAISAMERWQPDVAVICGTNFVQQRVLAPAARAFNIHAGCLPQYKGNHGIFFAFAEGKYELIGATIHEVSVNLDGGALIEIVRPPIYPADNDETLYCRSDQIAMLRLVDVLRMLECGDVVPGYTQPEGGRTFRHRDRTPWLELGVGLCRRLGIARVRCIPLTRVATTVYDSLSPERRSDPLIEFRRLED